MTRLKLKSSCHRTEEHLVDLVTHNLIIKFSHLLCVRVPCRACDFYYTSHNLPVDSITVFSIREIKSSGTNSWCSVMRGKYDSPTRENKKELLCVAFPEQFFQSKTSDNNLFRCNCWITCWSSSKCRSSWKCQQGSDNDDWKSQFHRGVDSGERKGRMNITTHCQLPV